MQRLTWRQLFTLILFAGLLWILHLDPLTLTIVLIVIVLGGLSIIENMIMEMRREIIQLNRAGPPTS